MQKRRILLLLLLQLVPLSLYAQNGNQSLNEELIVAVRKSNAGAVKTLLGKGADVNARTEYGATPLIYACDRGNVEVVKILLEHGADAKATDKFYQQTPAASAVLRDHAEVVKLLLEKDPQSRPMVMEMAIELGRPKTFKALLEVGGDTPDSLSKYLAAAERNKQTEIVEMLKKAGATPRAEYKVDAETLKIYEGFYKNDQTSVDLKLKDGKLVSVQTGRVFSPIDKHTFELDGQPPLIGVFNFDGDKAVSLTIKFPGGEMILMKAEAK